MTMSVVDEAITSRMSVRAFTPQGVPRELMEHILQVASRAPSGTNCQPWKVYVLQGRSRDTLVEQVCAAHRSEERPTRPWPLFTPKSTITIRKNGSALTSTAAARTVGAFMAWSALARGTRTRCTPSTSATTVSLMRRSV